LEAGGVLVDNDTCGFEEDVSSPLAGGELEGEGIIDAGSGGRVGLIGIVVPGRRRG